MTSGASSTMRTLVSRTVKTNQVGLATHSCTVRPGFSRIASAEKNTPTAIMTRRASAQAAMTGMSRIARKASVQECRIVSKIGNRADGI